MKPGTITIVDGKIVVTCQPHVAIKLRRMFGGIQRSRDVGAFYMAATPAHAYELDWFRKLHPLDVASSAKRAFGKLVATEKRKLRSIGEALGEGYVPRDFELAIPARDYQRLAADLAHRTRQLLLADDVGIGKTVSAIAALAAPGALPAVVVTMTHLPRQWESELARFAPSLTVHRVNSGKPYAFKGKRITVKDPDGKRRLVPIPENPDVILLNYHKLDGWAEALAGRVRTVVFDECQELRHSGSLKYDAALALGGACDLRLGLSATPIYNYGPEIFSVLEVIAPGALGTRKEFFDEWCGGGGDLTGRDARKICVADPIALGTHLRETGLMLRRTRKDVGRELPDLTVIRHVVEVNPERIHEAVASVAELAQRVLDRTGSNFELMKWSGEIDYQMRQATGIGKAGSVADLVRLLVESGEQVVLYGWHHEVYSLWRSAFERDGARIPYAMYTGAESETDKAKSVESFVAGRARVLIISLRAGAGLDGLQKVCRTVVVGELDWSPQVHLQNIGRVHRDGQTDKVVVYYAVAEEGSDPVIADVLGIKDAQARGIRDPEVAEAAPLAGASADHIRRLAEEVLRRRDPLAAHLSRSTPQEPSTESAA